MTKKKTVARAIGEKLQSFDWNVFDRSEKCSNCHKNQSPIGSRFCSNCGEELEPQYEDDRIIDEIYKAFTAGKRAEKKWNEKKQ